MSLHFVNSTQSKPALVYGCAKELHKNKNEKEKGDFIMEEKTLFLTNGMKLGTRLIGYEFYDTQTKGFEGMSESQIKRAIARGENIRGFVIGADGKLELDYENMRYSNLQMKSGVNGISWYKDHTGKFGANTAVIVIGKRKAFGKNMYEMIAANHARMEFDENKLWTLIEFADVYGVVVENGQIKLCTDIIREKKLAEEVERHNKEMKLQEEEDREASEESEETTDTEDLEDVGSNNDEETEVSEDLEESKDSEYTDNESEAD